MGYNNVEDFGIVELRTPVHRKNQAVVIAVRTFVVDGNVGSQL